MKNDTFGSRLLTRRKELKYSQAALGKRVGVAHVTISQWERGETEPTGSRLFALSKALQCSPTWLLFGDEDQGPGAPVESTSLSDQHKELIELFDSLPESEQEAQIQNLRARVKNFNRLFNELLQARKRQKKDI
ncbi:MAG: helix-turn-helix domain-containing protein [Enterobacter ludwigii]|nr:helix-turn-helix domain-containing protein [Enterobacter ludwigii]